MPDRGDHLGRAALDFARRDVPTLEEGWTIGQALDGILEQGVGERIVYFYVADPKGRLVGVVPTRRLLMCPRERPLSEVMIRRVVSLPRAATVEDALEAFVLYRFLAFPIVDEERRLLGLVDVGLFTDEMSELSDREQRDDIFETIGLRLSEIRTASPLRAFRYRGPWLLTTLASGTAAALIAGANEATLSASLVLAFFMTLVLGLGESVSVQSMTVTIQTLRGGSPTRRWFLQSLRREVVAAALLGAGAGLAVALIVRLWRGHDTPAAVIGSSILVALVFASLVGLSVPSLLHRLRLDPKIAAGPITLALTDVSTLLLYFGIARAFL